MTSLLLAAAAVSRRLPAFRGKHRVERALTALLWRGGPHAQVPAVVGGVRWRLDPREYIQQRLLWDGSHDPHVVRWLTARLRSRPQPVLWDVGANIGAVSLLTAALVPGLRVEAFEPSPGPRARLVRHVALNPSVDVRVHEVALSDAEGSVSFFESANPENGGLGTLYAASNAAATPVVVRAERGDALLSAGVIAPPSAIKIDVEGFEVEVLDGLKETLATHRPMLVVESSGYRLTERGLARDSIVSHVRSLGYDVGMLDAGATGGVRALDSDALSGNIDLACLPRASR